MHAWLGGHADRHHRSSTATISRTNHRRHRKEPEPTMMINSHNKEEEDDDDTRRRMGRRTVVAHLQQPNVIARLMGMDIDDADHAAVAAAPTPPLTARPAAVRSIVQVQVQRRRQTNKCKKDLDAESSGPSSSRLCLNGMMTMRLAAGSGWRLHRRRRDPDEEEEEELLRKMRQDLHLQAWKAASDYCSDGSNSRSSSSSSSSLVLQAIAQEDLRRQKMARYGFDLLRLELGQRHSKVTTTTPRQRQDELLLPLSKTKSTSAAAEHERATAIMSHDSNENNADAAAMPPNLGDTDVEPRSRDGHGHRRVAPAVEAQDLPSNRHAPTIVLLKPTATCSESDTSTGGGGVDIGVGGGQNQKTLLPALPKLHRDAGMSMLLQEVKDRVQRELTLLTATATTTGSRRGDLLNLNTPPASPSACWAISPLQQVTKEDDRGNKRRLFRSESFRAFRRDHRNRNKASGTAPPASPPEAARVLKSEKADHDDGKSMADAGVGGVTDDGRRSFRSECLTTKYGDDASSSPSPRLLLRSFSAPEPSGLSFSSLGRLFSFRRHDEASGSEPAAAVTSKRIVSAAGFSSFVRGTVSSLRRQGIVSTRNMMFRTKTHWSWFNNNKTSLGEAEGEIHPAKMETMEMPICCSTPPSPQTFNLYKVAQANLSELPPSPVSPLEVAAGHSSRHFFTDLHITLPAPELSPKCLSEFEPPASVSESSFRTDITAVEAACSRDKAYITELLIAAGLYDDSDADGGPPLSTSNARVDSMARPMPICDDVFEDVEDMYYYRGDYLIGGGMFDDHRMLFDLANEALQSLVVHISSRGGSSSLRRWVVDSTHWGVVARGKKLVDDVWEQVQALMRKHRAQMQEMQTIDGMVAYEVRRSVWAEVLLYEDVYVVGRKIERAIFDELVEDLLRACALEVFI